MNTVRLSKAISNIYIVIIDIYNMNSYSIDIYNMNSYYRYIQYE